MPYPRNPFFTGRVKVLEQLHAALTSNGTAALSGLGGIGKTQTAIEYAYRHREDCKAVFWAKADSRDVLLSGFVAIAGLLHLPEKDAQDQNLAVAAVKRWLEANTDWLLILDNADDLAIAREFIPTERKGHVLLTTRAQATGGIAQRVEIEEMGPEEGALFLLRRAKLIAKDAQLAQASHADRALAEEISKELDGLPLALDQAGAYIEETACGLSDYLGLYRSHGAKLLKRRGTIVSDHPDPVATTWALSFERVEKASPAAAELLRFCAFLHPDAIPEELITKGAPELGPVLEPVAVDPFELNAAIAETLKYSLLRRDPTAKTLDIHRLVQAVLKDGMNETTQHLWAERAVQATSRVFPLTSNEVRSWPTCARLLPHALTAARHADTLEVAAEATGRLLNQAGLYLYSRAEFAQVAQLYQRALVLTEQALGKKHPYVAACLNNLAELYHTLGRYTEAEPLYQRALGIWEHVLGSKHWAVATALNNLAGLYHDQEQYSKAETFYHKALAVREQVLGPQHPDVSASLNNLAQLYRDQGRSTEAEPLYQRALTVAEQALGPSHSDVAQSLNNLAEFYRAQGRYAEAEPLYQRALTIWKQTLGPQHPEIAAGLNNLALLYRAQGRYSEAESLHRQALAIREQTLGPDHPAVAASLNNLAWLYDAQGKYAEAEPLYQRALMVWENSLGSEHSNVAACLENYAALLRQTKREAEAAKMATRAGAIRAKHAQENSKK